METKLMFCCRQQLKKRIRQEHVHWRWVEQWVYIHLHEVLRMHASHMPTCLVPELHADVRHVGAVNVVAVRTSQVVVWADPMGLLSSAKEGEGAEGGMRVPNA